MTGHALRAFVAGAACLLASPLQAADGILIVERKTTAGANAHTSQIQIEAGRMRAEVIGRGNEQQTVIFDSNKQVLWVVDPGKKSYVEITKADVDAIGESMAGMMAQVQEQLKNLPPDQRAMIETMMRGRGMPGGLMPASRPEAPSTEYRKAGKERVGKWSCDKHEGYQNGQKKSELCTVDPKVLGFTAADFEVSRQLAEFFRKVMPQNADQLFTAGTLEEQGFSGVPIRRISSFGEGQTVTELTEAKRQTFPSSTFDVPAGYRKEAFGGLGR